MKSIEKFYDIPMGSYCGVLIREKQAKKLMKLLHKQTQEIKELLASDLEQIEVSDWSIAEEDGKNTVFSYYIQSSDSDKLERIQLINKVKQVEYCKEGVYVVNKNDNPVEVYLEWQEKFK